MSDTDREQAVREARRTLVEKSIQFADWAAGEGIFPAGNSDMDPAWFLSQYYDIADDHNYEAVAHFMGEIVFHSDTDRAPTPRVRDEDLLEFGWAPGNYMTRCNECGSTHHDTDKRSFRCRPCAERRFAAPTPPVDARLAEIRERVADAERGAFPTAWYGNAAALAHTDAVKDLRTLLAEVDRLAARVAALEEALRSLPDLLDIQWEDERGVQFDPTMMFGKGYDFDGLDCYREEADTPMGRFAVWPQQTGPKKDWAFYGGRLGWFQGGYETADAAKAEVARMCLTDVIGAALQPEEEGR